MISVLTTDAELEALGPEWNALWQRSSDTTPFQSPGWLLPWWRHFGTGLPRVAICRRAGELRGVLPLYILPGEHKALPIGAGTTDYLDVLGDPADLLDTALAALATDAIDTCDLVDIRPESALIGATRPGWSARWQEGAACPVLTLPTIRKTARRKLAMSRHRADRAGGWQVASAEPGTIRNHLDTLVRLHQQRWTGQGKHGVLADPVVLEFWREAAPTLLSAGLLRLNSLRIGGQIAAATAALLAPGKIFFYLTGFDEEHSYVSPGTLLLGAMLEHAMAEGRDEAHFLRGRESYKYAWGGVDRLNWYGRLSRDQNHINAAGR